MDMAQTCVENVDNLMRRNNLRMRGLKEYTDGENLKEFLGKKIGVLMTHTISEVFQLYLLSG